MPTSRRIIFFAVLGAFFIGAYFALRGPGASSLSPAILHYSNETYGISFNYPDTYTLTEMHASGSAMRAHHIITLIPAADLPPPENGEGPPAITIEAYQNDLDSQTAEGWIRNTSASNYKLGDGMLSPLTVAGFPALSYRWSGLYEGTTVVLARPKWVYALSVTYMEMGAPIVQDFVSIRDSFRVAD